MTRAKHYRILTLLGVVLAVLPLFAFSEVSPSDLQKEYGDKVLTLRHFYSGNYLHFDCGGNLIGHADPGVWEVEGQLRVQKIWLAGGNVHINGQRVISFYDADTKQMRDIASVTKKEAKAKGLRKDVANWAAKSAKVNVDVDCAQAPASMSEVERTMDTVFLSPQDSLNDFIPNFWRSWFERDTDAKVKDQKASTTKVGGSVKPPHATFSPDPEYSGIAKHAFYQATTVLWLVVDASGIPQDIHIAKPAGLGLDEQAILVVRKWRFDPATKDGQPVPVQINVEINFRLY